MERKGVAWVGWKDCKHCTALHVTHRMPCCNRDSTFSSRFAAADFVRTLLPMLLRLRDRRRARAVALALLGGVSRESVDGDWDGEFRTLALPLPLPAEVLDRLPSRDSFVGSNACPGCLPDCLGEFEGDVCSDAMRRREVRVGDGIGECSGLDASIDDAMDITRDGAMESARVEPACPNFDLDSGSSEISR